jgi:predicted RNA-binding Zn ribbon-like protein
VSSPPHNLQLVIDFVNTLDLETGDEALGTPDALAAWLSERELRPGRVTAADHTAALGLREALRAAMAAHNGGPPMVPAALDQAAQRGRLSVRFAPDGSPTLEPRATGTAGALAQLLVPVAEAAADGTWQRVKACTADDCQWAFYDHSRNRSARWCDMAVCGNRTKVRSYRTRRAARE